MGYCIYCGARGVRLTREHVIPHAIGGHLVLREASCDTCCQATAEVERAVLHESLLLFRTKLDYPTRKKQGRPARASLETGRPDDPTVLDVPVADAPAVLMLPVFAWPRWWAQRVGADGTVDGFGYRIVLLGTGGVARLLRDQQLDHVRFRVKTYDYAFARLLAKIAWGHAVLEWGRDAFEEVFVVPGILGSERDMGQWVGCPKKRVMTSGRVKLPSQPHHVGHAVLPEGWVVTSIQLFADIDPEMPEYMVVVGRLRQPSS